MARGEIVHLRALFGRYVWNGWVLEDAAIEELHDVEVCADDFLILTEAEGLWDRDVGVLERVEDPVLAVDLVGRLW